MLGLGENYCWYTLCRRDWWTIQWGGRWWKQRLPEMPPSLKLFFLFKWFHLWNKMFFKEVVSSLNQNEKSRLVNGILECLWTIRVSSCLLSAILWSLLWWGLFSLGCPQMYVPSTLEPLSSLCAPRLSPLGLHEDPSTFCYLWKMKIWNMRTLFPQTSFSEVSLIGENWLGIIVMGWMALPHLT